MKMVQQQQCARVIGYGMAVYLSALQIQENNMVYYVSLFNFSSKLSLQHNELQ